MNLNSTRIIISLCIKQYRWAWGRVCNYGEKSWQECVWQYIWIWKRPVLAHSIVGRTPDLYVRGPGFDIRSGHTFVSPSADSRRAVVSYWRKYVHEVLVNRLGGLSLSRKSVVRLTDMTLDDYRGWKNNTTTTTTTHPLQCQGDNNSSLYFKEVSSKC